MSSIIVGYNYDIFISYRQKDNKGDRWVSEFVEALKIELESTFKEEISVYFDINPHDGLLETHDVDASLKDKLQCLIFIPIISRTYCDPKSFAWEHEFKAFVEQASKDQFGMKVKLPNGNVANRVLPIKIYDLDTPDIKLCESVLGGVPRGIEFIYKSAGVNRPLNHSDNPDKNLNKTYYRDQINKVANAIKEIFTAIGKSGEQPEEVSKEVFKPVSVPLKSNKSNIIIGLFIALALVLFGYFIIPRLLKPQEKLEKSIAVLPFVDMSPEQDQDYFCDGITEEIINALTQIKNFKVIARTSVFAFKDKQIDLHEIGGKLDVETVLEGSIQKQGNRLRITTQLIKVDDGSQIWSERYDRDLKDVFSIEDEIASNIVEKLKLTLFENEKGKLSMHQAIDPIAYEAYLKGSYYWWRWSEENYINAIKCFQKVIEIEPDYAPAYAGIALTYLTASTWNNIGLWSPQEGVSKSKEAVQKAIQLDPMLSDSYVARGYARMLFDLDWVAAEMDFKRALELSPNSSLALDASANFLFFAQGKYNEAFTELKKALTLDPLSAALYSDLGVFYYMSGQMDQAIPSFRKALELDSNFFWAHLNLAYINLFRGDTIKALDEFQNLVKLTPSSPYSQQALGYVYGISGYRDKAQEVLSYLDKLAMTRYVPPSAKAYIYTGLGEKDAALDYLDKAYEERDTEMIFLNVDPPLFPLRSEPRFLALLKKVGFNNLTRKPG